MKLGIKKIEAVKQSKIALPYFKTYRPVYLSESVVWTSLNTSNISGSINRSSERTPAGELYSVTLTGKIVDVSGEVAESLQKITDNYVFKVTDMNGIQYLVGTNHFRSVLNYKHEIDELSRNVYDIEITHQSPHGALLIAGTISGGQYDLYSFKWLGLSAGDTDEVAYVNFEAANVNGLESKGKMLQSNTDRFDENAAPIAADWQAGEAPEWTQATKHNSAISFKPWNNYSSAERKAVIVCKQNDSGKTIKLHVVQKPGAGKANLVYGLSAFANVVSGNFKLFKNDVEIDAGSMAGSKKPDGSFVYPEKMITVNFDDILKIEFTDLKVDGMQAILSNNTAFYPFNGKIFSHGPGHVTAAISPAQNPQPSSNLIPLSLIVSIEKP